MKSLVRSCQALGLLGGTLLVTVFTPNIPALALPEKQITEKLNDVPVFLITNEKGIPLSSRIPEGQNGQKGGEVTQVFISGQEATTFMGQLRNRKTQDPKQAEILKSLQVTPVPLGLIYQKLQQTKNQQNRLLFALKPPEQDIQGAMELLRTSGQQVKQLSIVPVFMIRSAPDKGYVPATRANDKKEVIPVYFSKQDAQTLLSQVKQKLPKADIQVVPIDQIISTLEKKNDTWLNNLVFVPSSQVMQYIQTLPRNNAPNTAAPAKK